MFIITLLDLTLKSASAIGYSKLNVWDAKTFAFEYIKNFIIENDGKKYVKDSHNTGKIIELPENATCRHYFNINSETGNIEIFEVGKSTKIGWFYNTTEVIKNVKFIISITKTDVGADKTFDTKQIKFSSNDLNIAENVINRTKNEDNVMVRSLMGDLKEYLKTKPYADFEDVELAASS